jgi:hypothetical protein
MRGAVRAVRLFLSSRFLASFLSWVFLAWASFLSFQAWASASYLVLVSYVCVCRSSALGHPGARCGRFWLRALPLRWVALRALRCVSSLLPCFLASLRCFPSLVSFVLSGFLSFLSLLPFLPPNLGFLRFRPIRLLCFHRCASVLSVSVGAGTPGAGHARAMLRCRDAEAQRRVGGTRRKECRMGETRWVASSTRRGAAMRCLPGSGRHACCEVRSRPGVPHGTCARAVAMLELDSDGAEVEGLGCAPRPGSLPVLPSPPSPSPRRVASRQWRVAASGVRVRRVCGKEDVRCGKVGLYEGGGREEAT